MAHKKLIIRFNLDYNVCSLTDSNSLRSICSESAVFCWPRVEHYSGGLTLHTPDGGRPSVLCSGELRVWLKQVTLTPQPTHLFHPAATLDSTHFYPATFWLSGSEFQHAWPGPRSSVWCKRNVAPIFFEYNDKFKFYHTHVTSTIVNSWDQFFFLCISFLLLWFFIKPWNLKQIHTLSPAD